MIQYTFASPCHSEEDAVWFCPRRMKTPVVANLRKRDCFAVLSLCKVCVDGDWMLWLRVTWRCPM